MSENGLPEETAPRLAEIEVQEADFNTFSELGRARTPAASLSQATEGRLERSLHHRELRRPHGFEEELRAVFASDSGTWGGVVLMRETGALTSRPPTRAWSAAAAAPGGSD